MKTKVTHLKTIKIKNLDNVIERKQDLKLLFYWPRSAKKQYQFKNLLTIVIEIYTITW